MSDIKIELLIITLAVAVVIALAVVSVVLFVTWGRQGKKSDALFNARVVSVVLVMFGLATLLLMWLFYPDFFWETIRRIFQLDLFFT